MTDETSAASAADTGSPEQTVNSSVTITPEIQAMLDKLTAERKAANDEAARYRIEKKQREEAELQAQGKLTELNSQLQKERDELNAKYAETEALRVAQAAKLEAIENARRAELLAKLPTEKADAYKTVDLTLLEQITKDFSAIVPQNSLGADRGAGNQKTVPTNQPNVPFAGSHSNVINVLERILTQ